MANVTYRPHYQIINGIRFPSMFSPNCIRQAFDYKSKLGDTFVVTYPKCGTTWMQNIVLYTFRKGQELQDHSDFFKMCPFIDAVGSEGINGMPRPGAMKTHLPYHHIPYSPDAKYIFVLRNPKDCCTSLYYHTKMNVGFGYWDAEFDDFFELFMAGVVEYNDYFDHLTSWYPHRNDSQVFFTTYEDMKRDTKDVVLRVASFLGEDYVDAIQRDNNVLNNILRYSSFDYMKEHLSDHFDFKNQPTDDPDMLEGEKHMANYARSLNPPVKDQLQFVRKGIVGDWKNHMSREQSERLGQKFLDRTRGTEIQDMYKNYI